MAALTDSLPDSALTRLFAREVNSGRAVWFSLPGGAPLYEAGEEADQFYFLRAGRLGAFRHSEGRETQFLGVIRPGEPAGEMALVAGAPHSATVAALRDSEVLSLSRDDFFDAVSTDPTVMTELARLMILRNRQSATGGVMGEPSVFGFIGLSPAAQVRSLATGIAARIGKLGYRATIVGVEALRAPTEWFSNVERDHDFVLYVAEADELAWKGLVSRQGDRLFRVAQASSPPPPPLPDAQAAEPLQVQQLTDLILLHSAGEEAPRGSEAWFESMRPARLFHLREGSDADGDRIARVLTGQSVGLVLSGGGARAYAHVGAVRALHERGVPIDFVGGVSMGAIVAAGVAMGWDDPELDMRIRRAFVDSSPLDDIAFPMIALTHGDKVRERLTEHFGDRHIPDLWLPFFCLSANLTTGAYQLHRTGLVREALRASISLPGVLPPVTIDKNVLVDGAVLKNFPADLMRAIQLGPIVGVDVGRGRSIEAEDVQPPPSLWRWLISGDWRRGPPIVSVLIRSATVRSGAELVLAHQATDVLVQPDVDEIEIRDWKAFDQAVEIGHLATLEALDGLSRPVVDLRRRASLEEAALRGPPPGCLQADDSAGAGQSTLRCNNARLSLLTSFARFGLLTRQLRLKLRRPASYARADFVFSETNSEARKALDDWPAWHGGCLALVGPEGSGKTHLAMEWAARAKASVLNAVRTDLASAYGRPVLLEDAERAHPETLFHLINMAGSGDGLLMTSRSHPRSWPAELPDLRSRLNAIHVAEIREPDDAVLEGLLRKFFRERSIKPAEDVYPYLMRRIERSVRMAREIVARLDEAADAEEREITRTLARQILESDAGTLDLFE